MILKSQRQILAWHDAAGKEVPTHPVIGSLVDELVGRCAVTEDVHEESTARKEPIVHASKELSIIAHVLEHLD